MRLRIGLVLFLIGGAAPAETDWATAGKAWWAHVQFLADDKLEGRDVGSKGYEAAADYVVKQFKRAGLVSGAGSTYSQPVEFVKGSLDEPGSSLALVRDGKMVAIALGDDALLGWGSETIPDVEAPLVFAGYGLDIPEANYSDLKDPRLRGAVAVYLQPRMWLADPALSTGGASFGATWNPAKADQLLEGSGHTITEILDAADHDRPLPHFALTTRVRAHVSMATEKVQSRNVVGLRPGSDPQLKNEYVILSAHLDHLGVGQPVNGDAIFNGAMDNASGIASLIEIARSLKAGNVKTKRSIVVLAVTGEEKGELGSRYFAERSPVPGRVVADINMDMFLPLFPLHYLEVQGLNESTLGDDIRAVAAAANVEIQADKEPNANRFIRSDQYSFIKKGVPALAFKFGWIPGSPEEKIFKDWLKTRYHAVSDDSSQPVDCGRPVQ
jgi:hypothetical protein